MDPLAHLIGHAGRGVGVDQFQHGRPAQRAFAQIVGPRNQGGGLEGLQRDLHPPVHRRRGAAHVAGQQRHRLRLGDRGRVGGDRMAVGVDDGAVADRPGAARRPAVVVVRIGLEAFDPLDHRRGGRRHGHAVPDVGWWTCHVRPPRCATAKLARRQGGRIRKFARGAN